MAVVEALDNGKSIRETRDADTAVVVRHLYHYAGWAQLLSTELAGWTGVGVVGAIVPWNFPLMLLVWKARIPTIYHIAGSGDYCPLARSPLPSPRATRWS